jgi:hypothetical protein
MGHSTRRAALIYQHRTSLRDKMIANEIGGRAEAERLQTDATGAFPCYSCTSRPRTYLICAPESSPVQPVCETNVRGGPCVLPSRLLVRPRPAPGARWDLPTFNWHAMHERVVSEGDLNTETGADADLAALLQDISAARLNRMTANARALDQAGHLTPGLTVAQAADILWTYSSPELYDLLVLRRGWSPEHYGHFAAQAMIAALLTPTAPAQDQPAR